MAAIPGSWPFQKAVAADRFSPKGVRKAGSRLSNWLTADEAMELWQVPDGQTLTGKRIDITELGGCFRFGGDSPTRRPRAEAPDRIGHIR
jgi:hypothetical protein